MAGVNGLIILLSGFVLIAIKLRRRKGYFVLIFSAIVLTSILVYMADKAEAQPDQLTETGRYFYVKLFSSESVLSFFKCGSIMLHDSMSHAATCL